LCKYLGYKVGKQSLIEHYDMLEVTTRTGEKKEVWFDASIPLLRVGEMLKTK